MGPKEPVTQEAIPTQPEKIEINQDSFSLDPKLRVMRSLSTMKLRFINYLNRPVESIEDQGSRFGSCNEFTLGINQNNDSSRKNNMETSSSSPRQNNAET